MTDWAKTQELGRFAEDIAAEYLVSLGWKVLARNVRNEYGELDIVTADGKELVIVEVRARTIGKIQSPADSIGTRKLRTLTRSSLEFVNDIDWEGFWRIDVIAITFHDKKDINNWELEHIRDITAGMNITT